MYSGERNFKRSLISCNFFHCIVSSLNVRLDSWVERQRKRELAIPFLRALCQNLEKTNSLLEPVASQSPRPSNERRGSNAGRRDEAAWLVAASQATSERLPVVAVATPLF